MIVSGDEPDLLMGAWDLALDLGSGTVLGIVGARLAVAVIRCCADGARRR